jgi:transposase InsO family protein
MAVIGKGNARMKVNGITQVISEVYYIPELKNNLLSMGQLQDKGVTILIQHGKCKVFHPTKGLIIQSKISTNRMFVVRATMIPKATTCLQVVIEDESYLWHCRFGHVSFKGLRTLQSKRMVNGLPSGLPSPTACAQVCTTCLIGEQHRESIPKKSLWRASQKLELVHADICGPINPASNSNKRYFLSFIDDFSRKTWIYFLHEKSEAFTMFKRYKACVEKETGAYLKCLRTDRGGEFNSNEFEEFCKENGITRQLTTAYTPQQNGVAERKNRTAMNLVRCILTDKQVPKVFWPEAVKWCVHVLNRSPTLAVQHSTPEEAWSGMKPTVEYFRVFGCLAHVHVPDQRRIKLDDKSILCVLLGVSDESKAYRLFDPISKKIIVSRDVVFEETKGWNWDMSREEIISDVLEWGDPEEETDGAQNAQKLGTEDNENKEASSTGELGTDANENGEAFFKGMNEAGPSGTYAHSSVTHEVNPLVSGRVR